MEATSQRLNLVSLFWGVFVLILFRFLLYQCIRVATFLFYMLILVFVCVVLGVTSSINSLRPCFVSLKSKIRRK